jgi:hypothetical protein
MQEGGGGEINVKEGIGKLPEIKRRWEHQQQHQQEQLPSANACTAASTRAGAKANARVTAGSGWESS